MIYIVMGVSSSGKSLIGKKLANRLEIPFYDADDFHPKENVEKMKSGRPLNDNDRLPWLQILARNMVQWEQTKGAVLACSALKKAYRTILSSSTPVRFIYLKGTKQLIAQRMQNRSGHFMPQSLLDSQFKALEEPEEAITISIDATPEQIIQNLLREIDNRN